MFKGFGQKQKQKHQQKLRRFEFEFKHLMGEQVAAARKACISSGINPEFGQSLIALATGADMEGWLNTPGFHEMRLIIFSQYANSENIDTLFELEKAIQQVAADFAPKFIALVEKF